MSLIVSKVGWGQGALSNGKGGLTAQIVIIPAVTKMAAGGDSPRTLPPSALKPFNAPSPILLK